MNQSRMRPRVELVRDHLRRLHVDAVLLTALHDVQWACGFTGSNGLLLVRADDAVFLTDGRYTTQAQAEVRDARVEIGGHDLFAAAAENDLLSGCRRVAFQSDDVTVSAFESLTRHFVDIEWIPTEALLVSEVAAKSEASVGRIKEAQRLTETVFDEMLAWIRPGVSEKQIAAEIVYRHLRLGAERMAFEPIAASGPHSARPHGRPTDRVVESGEILLLDFGCFVDGYGSDMTRTIAIGRPDDAVREIYDLVLRAQQSAISVARSGMRSSELDGAARDIIEQAGYGAFFSHSLGHGVGRRIHEWPRVSYAADYTLPERCVVTIEPGIYLPERFGVRIEDMVQLHSWGCQPLTGVPKHLIII